MFIVPNRSTKNFARLTLTLAACIFLAGCNVVGAVGSKLFGNGDNPAEYTFPKDQPLLVIVEEYQRPGELQESADQLASLISDKLKELKVAPIIPTEKLLAFRTEKGTDYAALKITDIGRATWTPGRSSTSISNAARPKGSSARAISRGNIDAAVRVVDVDSGQTKWPDVGDGKEFNSSTPYSPKDAATLQRPSAIPCSTISPMTSAFSSSPMKTRARHRPINAKST